MRIFDTIERFADRIAVITDDGRMIDYAELAATADDVAAKLDPPCLVLQVCRNDLPSLAAYVGFQRAGAVTMLVNARTEPGALNRLLDAFRPAYLFARENTCGAVAAGEQLASLEGYRLLKMRWQTDYVMHDDLALLLGTSGSTGSTDYVRLTHANLAANTVSIVDYLGISEDDRAITTMPMSYSYGLSIINTHLHRGAAVICTETTLVQRGFWDLVADHQATTFGGVPFVYQMLKRLRFSQMRLPSLRYITQAGGRLDPALAGELAAACRDKNIEFVVMYGQTEATARISYVPADRLMEKIGSIGVAIPGGRMWLADDNGVAIEDPGQSGEIVYEGRNVSLGYVHDRHGLNLPDQNRGLLFTGDLARRDEEGYLYMLGRKSRFVKVFGYRVALDELEALLNSIGVDAVCGGRDDDLVIFVTDPSQAATVERFLAEQTSISRQGYRVRQLDTIPRSAAGKVLYASLPAD